MDEIEVVGMIDIANINDVKDEVFFEFHPSRPVSAKAGCLPKCTKSAAQVRSSSLGRRSDQSPFNSEQHQVYRRLGCNETSFTQGTIAFAGGPSSLLKGMLATEKQHNDGLAGPDVEVFSREGLEDQAFLSLPSNSSQELVHDAVKLWPISTPTTLQVPRTNRPNTFIRRQYHVRESAEASAP